MKQRPIRTKFHKMRELIAQDELYLTAPPGGGKALHHTEYNLDKKLLDGLLKVCEEAPKFVIDRGLLDLIQEKEFQLSLRDMHRAKVCRLPFPVMWIEISQPREGGSVTQYGVLLVEGQVGEKDGNPPLKLERQNALYRDPPYKWDFFAWVMSINKDPDGEYTVLSPH